MTIKAVCVHVEMSDNRGTLCDAEHSWLPVDVDNRKRCVTIPAVCMHVDMSDNRETCLKSKHSWLPVDVLPGVCDKEMCHVTINAVCVHFHVSDNRETMSDAETSCLPDDAVHFMLTLSDNKERLCDEKSGLRACSHER